MKNIFKNKWFILGIVAALIVAAVVLAIVLGGGKDNSPEPTGATQSTENTDGTQPSGDATEPSGDATEPSEEPEGTKPEENFTQVPVTDPDDLPPESEYTGPGEDDPSEPDEPVVEPIDPTDEPDINPDDPDDPVVPPVVERPDKEYDFTGITPGNITAAQWNSWDADKKQAFMDDVVHPVFKTLTIDEMYNYVINTRYNGYSCGTPGHYCVNAEHHQDIMEEMAAGCYYCGKSDCPSFLCRDEEGLTTTDKTKCPEYSIQKDPAEYCQVCGEKYGPDGCHQSMSGRPCDICGAERGPEECHHCYRDE